MYSILKRIARNLRYKELTPLIRRTVLIPSIEGVESEIVDLVGSDIPFFLGHLKNEHEQMVGTIRKYGLLDLTFEVSGRLPECEPFPLHLLRDFGLVTANEDSNEVSQEAVETWLWEDLAEEAQKSVWVVKLMLHEAGFFGSEMAETRARQNVDLKSLFPLTFEIADACLCNSHLIWFAKHFYM